MITLEAPMVEELAEAAERRAAAFIEVEEPELKLLAFELWRRACSDANADPWVSDGEALLCRASCL